MYDIYLSIFTFLYCGLNFIIRIACLYLFICSIYNILSLFWLFISNCEHCGMIFKECRTRSYIFHMTWSYRGWKVKKWNIFLKVNITWKIGFTSEWEVLLFIMSCGNFIFSADFGVGKLKKIRMYYFTSWQWRVGTYWDESLFAFLARYRARFVRKFFLKFKQEYFSRCQICFE